MILHQHKMDCALHKSRNVAVHILNVYYFPLYLSYATATVSKKITCSFLV